MAVRPFTFSTQCAGATRTGTSLLGGWGCPFYTPLVPMKQKRCLLFSVLTGDMAGTNTCSPHGQKFSGIFSHFGSAKTRRPKCHKPTKSIPVPNRK